MEIKAFKWLKHFRLLPNSIINYAEYSNDVHDSKISNSKLQKGQCLDPIAAAISSFLTSLLFLAFSEEDLY